MRSDRNKEWQFIGVCRDRVRAMGAACLGWAFVGAGRGRRREGGRGSGPAVGNVVGLRWGEISGLDLWQWVWRS